MYEGISLFLSQLSCVFCGFIIYIAVEHHFCTVALGPVNLHQRRRRRHYDHCLAAIRLGSICYALGMVPGRSGHQSFASLFLCQSAYLIVSSSYLVSAGDLKVLRFEIDLVSGLPAKVIAVYQFCLHGNFFYHIDGFFKGF